MSNNVYLNGQFLPIEEANISVMDRGFLFGDGVYEVIPVYGGKLFRLEQHLNRLNNSLSAIHMENPHTTVEWQELLTRLVDQMPGADQAVYLQVTRGIAAKRDHAIPEAITATVFSMSRQLEPPTDEAKRQGIAAVTQTDIRWQHCNIKAITLLANVLAREEARLEGAQEAILVRDSKAVEGAASNLFIIKDGLLITPPNSEFLLPGVTRDLVLELTKENGIPFAEAEIGVDELRQADEIWMTSSTKEVLPVLTLDGETVGAGVPGPMWEHMNALYDACKERLRLTGDIS